MSLCGVTFINLRDCVLLRSPWIFTQLKHMGSHLLKILQVRVQVQVPMQGHLALVLQEMRRALWVAWPLLSGATSLS